MSSTTFSLNLPGGFGDESTESGLPASIERWISDNLILFLVLAGAALVLLLLVALVFSTISRGALVEAVIALHGEEDRDFSSAWRTGLAYFWRVLGLALLLFSISLGILIAVGAPAGLLAWAGLVAADSVGLRILFVVLVGLLAFVLLVLLFVPLYVVWQLALRELVAGGEGVTGSLRGGYRLFRRNLGRSLLTWLLQVALAIAVGTVVAVVGTVYGLLLYGMVAAIAALEVNIATAATTVVAVVLFFSVAVAVSGILGTFFSGYWTLAYLRLRGESNNSSTVYSG
ncbi:MAG: hypothetical protein WA990_16045 [Rubrobacteraceae bacterium]